MNKVYSLVWDAKLCQMVVASELASTHGKAAKGRKVKVLLAVLGLACMSPAYAQYQAGGGTAGAPNSIAVGGNGTNCPDGVGTNREAEVAAGNDGGIAIGCGAFADGVNDDTPGSRNDIGSVAIGLGSRASGPGVSTAVGREATATGEHAVALGFRASATGTGATAIGTQARALDVTSTAVGSAASALANGATALGNLATARGVGSMAIGGAAQTGADARFSTAIGAGSAVLGEFSTAIGLQSMVEGDRSLAFGAGSNTAGDRAVAIGAGANAADDNSVALGADSATAPTVATLSGVIGGNTYIYAGGAPVGTVSVGTAGNERTITNVGAGRISADSTDAINGSQLHATNQAVEQLGDRVTNVEGDIVNLDNRLTNVEGDISDLDNRVTNVEGDITNLDNRVTVLEDTVVDVTDLKNGADGMFQVSQEGPLVKPTPTGTNSAAGGNGAVASGSNAFASGNQAMATGNNSTAVGTGARATANNSTALGQGATASHANSVAIGTGSQTTRGAQSDYNAAYVGSSSSSGEANFGNRTLTGVAPGIAGTDAVNVNQLNAGVNHAINQANQYTDNRINKIQNDVWTMERGYRSATASAMAMAGMPQAYLPGKSMLAVGVGGYQGEYGMAVGLSGITDNGRYVYKASASGNTSRDWGFSVGAGIQW